MDVSGRISDEELARRARSLGKDGYAERADAGGAPPPPPLQEELASEGNESTEEGEAEAGSEGSSDKARPGSPGRGERKREIQGG